MGLRSKRRLAKKDERESKSRLASSDGLRERLLGGSDEVEGGSIDVSDRVLEKEENEKIVSSS